MQYNGSINGLIRKLQKTYTQIENSGIFKLTASSIHGTWYPKNVLYDDGTGFHTDNNGIPGEFLQFDFLENLISISSYTIKSRTEAQSKNWKVNASIDGINWNTIHEVIEDLSMCYNGVTKSFFIQDQTNYRFIRFISTGNRCGLTNVYFNVFVIEFFGSINQITKTQSLKFNYYIFLNFCLILLF